MYLVGMRNRAKGRMLATCKTAHQLVKTGSRMGVIRKHPFVLRNGDETTEQLLKILTFRRDFYDGPNDLYAPTRRVAVAVPLLRRCVLPGPTSQPPAASKRNSIRKVRNRTHEINRIHRRRKGRLDQR